VPAEVETAILDYAVAHPCHGPMRVAHELTLRGIQVSSGGVRGVWQRHSLLTDHDRLLRVRRPPPQAQPVDEQIKLLERFSPKFRERHIEAPHTGALVAVDTLCPVHDHGQPTRQCHDRLSHPTMSWRSSLPRPLSQDHSVERTSSTRRLLTA
jgi:hypothetical protein